MTVSSYEHMGTGSEVSDQGGRHRRVLVGYAWRILEWITQFAFGIFPKTQVKEVLVCPGIP